MNKTQEMVMLLQRKAELITQLALTTPIGSKERKVASDEVDDLYERIGDLTLLPEYWEGTKVAYREVS